MHFEWNIQPKDEFFRFSMFRACFLIFEKGQGGPPPILPLVVCLECWLIKGYIYCPNFLKATRQPLSTRTHTDFSKPCYLPAMTPLLAVKLISNMISSKLTIVWIWWSCTAYLIVEISTRNISYNNKPRANTKDVCLEKDYRDNVREFSFSEVNTLMPRDNKKFTNT